LLPCSACFLRPAVRPVSPAYRSQESYGTAHWGMTHDELAQAVADLAPCGSERFCRDEVLKEHPARVSYELLDDRLIRVRLRVASTQPQADYEQFRKELTQEYGPRSELSSARIRVGQYAVVALMDAVGGVYKPILGPWSPSDQGWATPETEMRLASGPSPQGWLELTLTSRYLAGTKVTLEGP
jgi:hypothetical protein